jgi:hypothetical protein
MRFVGIEIDACFAAQGERGSASIFTNPRFAKLCAGAFFSAISAIVFVGFEGNTFPVADTAISAVKDAFAVLAAITHRTRKSALSAVFGVFVKLRADVVAKARIDGATHPTTTAPADANFSKWTGFSAGSAVIRVFLHVGAAQIA